MARTAWGLSGAGGDASQQPLGRSVGSETKEEGHLSSYGWLQLGFGSVGLASSRDFHRR